MNLNRVLLLEIIDRALMEDMGTGDITTNSIVPENYTTIGFIRTKEAGIIAGLEVAREIFLRLNAYISFQARVKDGDRAATGQLLARVEGDARSILCGERVALNFLQRMSGIATRTAFMAGLIAGEKARLVDTRKTTPGLKLLEKYAVRVGGGCNHRFGLYDAVLIKDNHLKVAGSISEAVRRVKAGAPFTSTIEVEVESLEGVLEALDAGADIIMLDNMSVADMKKAVEMVSGKAVLEASGGINESILSEVARTGVDYISVGSLTHSVKSLDISMDIGEMKPISGYVTGA